MLFEKTSRGTLMNIVLLVLNLDGASVGEKIAVQAKAIFLILTVSTFLFMYGLFVLFGALPLLFLRYPYITFERMSEKELYPPGVL
jgi:hypothetical protein